MYIFLESMHGNNYCFEGHYMFVLFSFNGCYRPVVIAQARCCEAAGCCPGDARRHRRADAACAGRHLEPTPVMLAMTMTYNDIVLSNTNLLLVYNLGLVVREL